MENTRINLLQIINEYCGGNCNIDDSCLQYLSSAFRDSGLEFDEKIELLIGIFPDLGCHEFDSRRLLSRVDEIFQTGSNMQGSDEFPLLVVQEPPSEISEDGNSHLKMPAVLDSNVLASSRQSIDSRKINVCSVDEDSVDSLERSFIDLLSTWSISAVALDSIIISYLSDAVQELQEIDGCGLLESYVPELSGQPERLECLRQLLLDGNKVSQPELTSIGESNARESSCLADLKDTSEVDAQVSDQSILTELQAQDISFLCEMMPEISEELIQFTYLVLCASNRVEAGRVLVESSHPEGMEELHKSLQTHQNRIAKAAEDEKIYHKKLKSMVAKRYGDQEVLPRYDKNGREINRPAIVFMSTVGGGNQKVRYREGNAVTHRGEKTGCKNVKTKYCQVIIERNPAEDYDGGSRGRVKPKGKRGPGWVKG